MDRVIAKTETEAEIKVFEAACGSYGYVVYLVEPQ